MQDTLASREFWVLRWAMISSVLIAETLGPVFYSRVAVRYRLYTIVNGETCHLRQWALGLLGIPTASVCSERIGVMSSTSQFAWTSFRNERPRGFHSIAWRPALNPGRVPYPPRTDHTVVDDIECEWAVYFLRTF